MITTKCHWCNKKLSDLELLRDSIIFHDGFLYHEDCFLEFAND